MKCKMKKNMTKRRNRITLIFRYIIFKAIPHKDSAADAPPIFCQNVQNEPIT